MWICRAREGVRILLEGGQSDMITISPLWESKGLEVAPIGVVFCSCKEFLSIAVFGGSCQEEIVLTNDGRRRNVTPWLNSFGWAGLLLESSLKCCLGGFRYIAGEWRSYHIMHTFDESCRIP